jgi:hypothetical protein
MPNKHDSERVCLSLWVHKDFKRWLKVESKRRHMTMSEWIRLACRKLYERGPS